MSLRRGLTASLLAGTLLVGTAGAALGHECVISSRSAQGDAGALHSGRWVRLGLADVYGFIHEVVQGPALTSSQIAWAVGESVEQGLPAGGWVLYRTGWDARANDQAAFINANETGPHTPGISVACARWLAEPQAPPPKDAGTTTPTTGTSTSSAVVKPSLPPPPPPPKRPFMSRSQLNWTLWLMFMAAGTVFAWWLH